MVVVPVVGMVVLAGDNDTSDTAFDTTENNISCEWLRLSEMPTIPLYRTLGMKLGIVQTTGSNMPEPAGSTAEEFPPELVKRVAVVATLFGVAEISHRRRVN
eukprot:TRINITY_DN5427_c0_g1_i1.p2 TRINITY_DN5427_c0_g1~~TRINITY_DN5427_c0_g1_i1.p2  ORF type:complete len:102 (+),score=3.86 TRINITY_DN5427_c0_g1_i1:960-1265(+)